MADSNITKQALSGSLKKLLTQKPLEKISVADICTLCGMNRKSFYYHFKDKYDLVNWIYYNEFVAVVSQKEYDIAWDLLQDLCGYLYENRSFYRKSFYLSEQNPFTDYFTSCIAMVLEDDICEIFASQENLDFYIGFYTDAFVVAIRKWIMDSEPMEPSRFCHSLETCLVQISKAVIERLA